MRNWLLKPEERGIYDIEFDFSSLLRADDRERFTAYKEGIMAGFMTPNEARLKEGWKPISGGDNAYMQQQNIPLQQLGVTNETQPASN